ncbi:MAG: HD domain-containing protein [Nitrospiraceae bacterium]|nr:MAG: HD domain-containing protein [Nitrospiraceae bacterium]
MKSRLSIFIISAGWLLAGSYLYYDYAYHQAGLFRHIFSINSTADTFFHLIIISTLIGTHVTAYLVNERRKLLIKTMKSEEQLKHAAHEWKATFDSIPYGVLLTDRNCNIIRANRYVEHMVGIPVKELISDRKCHDIICKQNKSESICAAMKAAGFNATKTYEFHDNKQGSFVNESITPMFDKAGEITSFVHVLIDITDSREKEKKLSQSKDAFFNMLKDVDSAYKDLKDIHNNLLMTFSNIIDAKSPWTRGHSMDVANYSTVIAREMGLDEREIETLRIAALLHDIGKIGTYDEILDKPDKLNDVERTLIRQHTIKGEDILKPIKGLRNIIPIIRSHHERVDGTGYPDGLKGDKIHPLARILCVADSYDAMISDRPYRSSRGTDYAITEIRQHTGTQFDTRVSEAFLNILGRGPDNLPSA